LLLNGQKGSGKSRFAAAYAEKWQKMYKKSPIFLLSNKKLADEPAFEKLKHVKEIPFTKESLEEIIGEDILIKHRLKKPEKKRHKRKYDSDDDDYSNIEDEEEEERKKTSPHEYFKSKTGQSLVIFDDFEGTSFEKLIRILIDNVVSVGRSSRIYVIIITHVLCGGQKTKLVLGEVDAYVLFPEGISPSTIKYCLEHNTRLNENQITKIVDSSSEWVFIHRAKPAYVVEQHRLWMF
jgi:hypothetical protein